VAEHRSWEIECVGARPLTINAVSAMHRMQWAQRTREIRRSWWALTKAAKVPHIGRAWFEIVPLHANLRTPQDPGACAAEAKAAIDGIVDAGVLEDDCAPYVTRITFHPPDVCGVDGMRIRIHEVAV
jgi:hypothetical protein